MISKKRRKNKNPNTIWHNIFNWFIQREIWNVVSLIFIPRRKHWVTDSVLNDKTMMDVCNGPVWNQNLRFHPENIEEENWKRTLLGIVCVSDVCIESQVFQITIICGLLLLKIFIFRGTRFENWALFHYGVRKHNNKSISHLGIISDFRKKQRLSRISLTLYRFSKVWDYIFSCIILTYDNHNSQREYDVSRNKCNSEFKTSSMELFQNSWKS